MAEKDEKCQAEMQEDTICGRELYDEEHCIFHSQKSDKDVKVFQEKLDEIFKDNSLKIYRFYNFVFPKGISFPKEIDRDMILCYSIFEGKVDFSDTIFQGGVDFRKTTFKNMVDFMASTFKKEAYFEVVTFKNEAHIEGINFEGRTSFEEASFESDTYFWGTLFQSEALFGGSNFKGIADLTAATFEKWVDFRGVTFENTLKIDEESKEEDNKIFSKGVVDFRYVRFLKAEKVNFRKVDLSKFRFLGTDLRKVEFIDVDWYKEKGKGRNKIYDEVSPDPHTKKFDYSLIAQVYKRLRANYEENLNYAEAGDFHIGEMEMRRKGEKNTFNKAVIWAYKLISNYGESFWKPLGWIAIVLLIFPLIYMLAGVSPKFEGGQIQYHLDFSLKGIIPTFGKMKDYWSSFVYSLSVFSLIRERPYQTINDLGHFFTILESIFSPVLIAFFLLALRRRFKR